MRQISKILAGIAVTTALAFGAPGVARADDGAAATSPHEAAREYYSTEMKTAFLFVGYGAVTAGAGGVSLTESGDFAHGFGGSSLILGSVTAIAGLAYGAAVKLRGDYFTGLAKSDPARFQQEEGDRIAGTNKRFYLYLGSELVETLAGIGIATYGFVAKNDLYKGIGAGTALQGIGLFVIDAPGWGRAAKYQDDVRRFDPKVGVTMGGGTRPWAATVSQAF
jgi:hypothetical protein